MRDLLFLRLTAACLIGRIDPVSAAVVYGWKVIAAARRTLYAPSRNAGSTRGRARDSRHRTGRCLRALAGIGQSLSVGPFPRRPGGSGAGGQMPEPRMRPREMLGARHLEGLLLLVRDRLLRHDALPYTWAKVDRCSYRARHAGSPSSKRASSSGPETQRTSPPWSRAMWRARGRPSPCPACEARASTPR